MIKVEFWPAGLNKGLLELKQDNGTWTLLLTREAFAERDDPGQIWTEVGIEGVYAQTILELAAAAVAEKHTPEKRLVADGFSVSLNGEIAGKSLSYRFYASEAGPITREFVLKLLGFVHWRIARQDCRAYLDALSERFSAQPGDANRPQETGDTIEAKRLYLKTPVFTIAGPEAGQAIHFKMECHQPTRSFKLRGMDHICRHYLAQGVTEFVASSGGNAGYSLAWAGTRLGAQVTVVVPESTSQFMRDKIAEAGGKVVVHGLVWNDADALARSEAAVRGAAYISPFDHPQLWEGHATMIAECAEQMAEPELIVVAVGGGGMLCGVLQGMAQVGWTKAHVLAAETEGAASFGAMLAADALVTLDKIDTIASTLGAKTVAEEALAWSRKRDVKAFTCTDREALQACEKFVDDANVLVEPACGAALSAVYVKPEVLNGAKNVLVIACGGAAVNLATWADYAGQFLND